MGEYNLGAELKRRNRNDIYRLLLRNNSISKQQILHELGLSLPTITQNLHELTEEGLVRENGFFCNTGGRRARGYTAAENAKVAIGLDLNKHHFSAIILNLRKNVIARSVEYADFRKDDAYYKLVAEKVYELIYKNNIPDENILGVGIAVQGIIAPDGRTVSYGNVLGITGLTLDELGRYIKYPKSLLHDSDMAAQAEHLMCPENGHAVYISLSTNLGGAVIGSGLPFSCSHYGLGRIEHMVLYPKGKKCYCGQLGCADAYCSTHILSMATPDGRLSTFFEQLKNDDAASVSLWDEYMENLSVLINNAHIMFDSPVILGGYLAEFLGEYIEKLKQITYAKNTFDSSHDYIRLSKITTEPISVGAALQYINDFIITV